MTKANSHGTPVYADKTSEYTQEERDMLWSYIESAYQESSKVKRARGELIGVLGHITDYYGHDLYEQYFTEKQWKVLCMPLEEIPIYINDKDNYVAGIARWSLFLGR
jgi:hypothetical protein